MLNYRPTLNVVPACLVAGLSTIALASETVLAQDRLPSLASNVRRLSSDQLQDSSILARPAKLIVREVTLEAAFDALESSSGVAVAYSPALLPKEQRVTCLCQEVTIEEAMAELLGGTGLELLIATDQVVIRQQRQLPAPRLAPGATIVLNRTAVTLQPPMPRSSVTRQDHVLATVSGRVTERGTGRPLESASVQVAGTGLGAFTDADGRFAIQEVPAGEVEVQVQILGYVAASQTVNVPSEGTVTVNFELEQDPLALDELVVTAFGVEREVRSLTYSTQSINTAPLTTARELNVINSLKGKVAGLSINQAATGVGSSSRVVLRGNRSISGNSQPLYVLDGVPIRGGISDINPDDIASIDVLKGPNAAALYGAAAQNGAIVISTHRGAAGATRLSINQTFMSESPILADNYQNVYGQGAGGVYDPASEYSWGPTMDAQLVDYWRFDDSDHMDGLQYAFLPQPDNIRDAFQTGFSSATNVTASIGGPATQAAFSYTYTDAQGMLPGNDLDRHNLSLRVTSDLLDRLSLDTRVSYMRRSINNQLATGENFANPLRHIYRLPRNIRTQDMESFEYTNTLGELKQNYFHVGSNGGANPYWTLNRNLNANRRERVLAMASLTYSFTDALNLLVRASYDGAQNHEETRLYNDSYVIAPLGEYELSSGNATQWNADLLLSYAYDMNEEWSIDANIGGSIQENRNTSLSSNTGETGLVVPNLFTLSNTLNVESDHSYGSPFDLHSLYASTQFAWRQSLFLDVTARNDWSSTLPVDNRSYLYPSVGLSGALSDLLPIFPDFVSFVKLRSSWARVGNSPPPFMLNRLARVNPGGNAGFLTLSSTVPNTDLRPEQTESIELGADVRLFQGRLGLDFTWYKMNTRNQLFTVAVPVGSGAAEFFTNGGDVENKGVELIVSARPVRAGRFGWDLDITFARNRNMVVAISDERPRLVIGDDFLRDFVIEEGQPFGQVYSRDLVRDEQGRVIVGSDGMPRVTPGKTEPVADFNPDWTAGIGTTLTYGNLGLSVLIDHRQGGTITSLRNAVLYADGLTKATLEGREGGLIFGDNFFAHETAVLEDGSPNDIPIDAETFWRGVGGRNAPVGGLFVEDATNTRVRELTLDYNVPASLLGGLPVSGLRLSLVGRNLFFIHKESENLDPDILVNTSTSAGGFESFTPPTARSLGLSIRVGF